MQLEMTSPCVFEKARGSRLGADDVTFVRCGVAWVTLLVLLMVGCTHQPGVRQPDARASELRSPTVVHYTKVMQVQDLGVLRELDAQVKAGEITEEERTSLWEAYLTRLHATRIYRARLREYWTGQRIVIFTGPGF